MRAVHMENVDLNLLKALAVLLEERHVSRAAARMHLTQSAMSRTLARLRETFGDELLVRTQGGYELTPRARAVQDELAVLMPRLRMLIRGSSFDPSTATDTVRIAGSDYAATVIGDELFPRFVREAPHMSLVVTPVLPSTFADLDQGRVDLVLTPIDAPDHLNKQELFFEDFVCALSRTHPITAARLSIGDLASYPLVTVGGMNTQQRLVTRQLEQAGIRPQAGITVPFFSTAATAAKGTTLIAVLPRRLAWRYAGEELRIAEAPPQIAGINYPMVWHPRVTGDPVHQWVRSLVAIAGAALSDTPNAMP
ncbi:LysR family transcriptional regulator [Cryptosporangium sp. NPDC048952]|uniref:LysR family transcriptional regulator n=1 Tax=Cryptosporangium sp. NPDC048952 TaxID=3363961 RepID=UPI0037197E14